MAAEADTGGKVLLAAFTQGLRVDRQLNLTCGSNFMAVSNRIDVPFWH
jgi:hypothetical protein